MKGMMKVAQMPGIQEIELVSLPIPEVKENEVLVKLEYVGVCGSDLHFYELGRNGECVVEFPFVLGHEPAGTVVETGAAVTHLSVGDRVALEPGRTCGHCEFCRSGRYHLCPDVQFFATPPYNGTFQEYIAHEAALCFKLPDNVDTMEGALIEPLAVGFHAARQAGAKFGDTAMITGSGCIGLVTLMALKTLGVTEVFVVDLADQRLEKAEELGAAQIINAGRTDPVAEIMRLTNGRGVDLAFECSGNEICASQCIHALIKGGVYTMVGFNGKGEMTLPTSLFCDKELAMKSVFRYHHIYPLAIKAVAEGKVNVKGIVSHIYDLDHVKEAMDNSMYNKQEVVKAVIKIGE